MAQYQVRIEARDGNSCVTSTMTVNAESDFMAERLAIAQFKSRNAAYRNRSISATNILKR